MYNEKFKTFKKEIEERKKPEERKISHVYGRVGLTFGKMSFYQKQSTDQVQSPSKFDNNFSCKLEKKLTFQMEAKVSG